MSNNRVNADRRKAACNAFISPLCRLRIVYRAHKSVHGAANGSLIGT
jgi:hypothetical protein